MGESTVPPSDRTHPPAESPRGTPAGTRLPYQRRQALRQRRFRLQALSARLPHKIQAPRNGPPGGIGIQSGILIPKGHLPEKGITPSIREDHS